MGYRTRMLGLGIAGFALLGGCPSDDGPAVETEGDDSTGTASGSSGAPMCADPETQALYADADTTQYVEPMALAFADMLGRDIARSHTAEMGTVTFEFTTTCAGPVYLWALVWDFAAGTDPENPDSLYVSIDGGEEQVWIYGCSTGDGVDQRWWWLPIEAWSNTDCEHAPLELELPEGSHTLVFRNREMGSNTDVAALAAVALSHDMNADPTQFIEPPV